MIIPNFAGMLNPMANQQPTIILISNDKVGRIMAGPGIRYWELTKALAKHFPVTLLVPDECDLATDNFPVIAYQSRASSTSIARNLPGGDYLIAQNLRPPLIRIIKKRGLRYLADLYDPLTIEVLEYTKYDSPRQQNHIFQFNQNIVRLQIAVADHLLCASPRQKDFYLGLLSNEWIINPRTYQTSPSFAHFISLLPFGISAIPPHPNQPHLLEEKYPAIKPTDKIIYWGGGIWNWFDPLTTIKAIEKISRSRSDVKLFFLGTRHPNPKIKEMEMVNQAIHYCQTRQLLDKTVFFRFGWTPYEERVNYLTRATLGISCHFDTLETHFSFRTRIMDYLWAELPMILTKGDYLAELAARHNLGRVVQSQDTNGLAQNILALLNNPNELKTIKANIHAYKQCFYWDNLVLPLVELIKNNAIPFRPFPCWQFSRLSCNFYLSGFKKKFFK